MTTAAALMIIGRVIFGGFFLIAGIRNWLHFGERRSLTTNYGWKMPAWLTAIGFTIQLVGGLLLILGLWPVWAAIALIVFLVPATALFHNLFLFAGKERDPHLYFVLVNIALSGGLLLVVADAL